MKNKEERKQEEKTIIKETTTLSLARYASEFIFGIRGFIIASFLGPALYGIWNIFTTLISSAQYLGFGTLEAMVREVPFNIGKKRSQDNVEIQKTSFTWELLLSLIVSVIILLLTFTNLIKEYKIEVRLLGLVLILNNTYDFIKAKLNSERKIYQLANYDLVYAIFNTLFGLSLLFFYYIKGLLLGMVISQLILIFYSVKKDHFSIRFQLQIKVLTRLIKIGFPIMILAVSFFLMQNIDKFIVFFLLGSTMTGYYGLASFISLLINYIPGAMSNVLFPRMMHKYGRTNKKKDLEEYFTQPITVMAYGMPILLGVIFIIIGPAITYLLPKYLPSIFTIRILILSLFFSVLLRIPTDILIALNKQRKLMYLQIGALIFGGLLDYIAIMKGYGIEGVALATAFTFMILSIITNIYALYSLDKTSLHITKELVYVYFPFLYGTIGLFVAGILLKNINILILQSILKLILFLLFCIPLLFFLNRYGVITKFIDAIYKKNN